MKHVEITSIIEKIAWLFKRDNLYINKCIVKEKTSKYEVYFKFDKNPAGIFTVKIIFSKNNYKFRVYSGKTSLDLKLKRFIQREIIKMAGSNETST